MRALIARFTGDDRGATAMEYGLIIALISIAIVASVTGVGQGIQGTFNNLGNRLSSN